ncbi:MAG TPA: ATP-binding protein [Tepidisphaeraceae bacterium]|nr:ATP-binding protein [Tepidisphaeraceae bacterium]
MSVGSPIASTRRPATWPAFAVSAALIASMALLRLVIAARFPLPIGYGVPIALMALFRSRRALWVTTAGFVVLAVVKFFILLPEEPRSVHISAQAYDYLEGLLVVFDLLLVSLIIDVWIRSQRGLVTQNTRLESANAELAAREEEIARQNEELQSQTEELERQSEELRVTNEELAHREKVLEILLSLSRSLNTELSADEIMGRICQTLGLLINGPTAAAAILERRGDKMVVRCHHGFGSDGLLDQSITSEQSFGALILSRGRTGYIEDLSVRPDLRVPQPKAGEPIAAILATPLRVRGVPIGSLEVYSRHKTSWNQEQVALLESLAAQTSVSLEAAQLFETVSQERNRFEAVLRTAPVGIAVCNSECSEVRLNLAAAALLSLPADRVIARESLVNDWPAFRNGHRLQTDDYPLIRAARLGEEIHGEELENVLTTGRRIICLTYARPIRDGEGRIQGAVCIFVDITAQNELQRELDTRRREAEEASVRKTRFLAAVSHDIRTPANAISLLAELIRRTASTPALSDDVPELAQELHRSASSLVNLLSDVLDVARFDSNKVDLQESEFSLAGLLADEQKQLLPLAREKGLSLEFNIPSDPMPVRTDRIKLSRILGNLVGNAIKFTESGGVKVDAHRNGNNTIMVTVADTGVGIAGEAIPYIFDEFFQLRNPERDRAKGSGLGLAICKRLVDAMGGQIDVASAPGQGSTFSVTLPAFATVPTFVPPAPN